MFFSSFPPSSPLKSPRKPQARFSSGENGTRSITFKLSGSLDAPVSNLGEKLALPETPINPDAQASLPGTPELFSP
ncbi:MAG: hypothetical protein HC904_00235 [Blastochloris sp.]|nr:hypothetical protein [Blastochloris sp.]